jgi:hypothetical protein
MDSSVSAGGINSTSAEESFVSEGVYNETKFYEKWVGN